MKVFLKLDVLKDDGAERAWERQVWVGEMPFRPSRSEYDPLLLMKEYTNGAEFELFRLDDFNAERGEVTYRPAVFHPTHWFLKSLPKWGFMMEPVVNRESI